MILLGSLERGKNYKLLLAMLRNHSEMALLDGTHLISCE